MAFAVKSWKSIESRQAPVLDLRAGRHELRIHWITALSVALLVTIIRVFLTSMALKARQSKVLTETPALLDEVGTARTSLTPIWTGIYPR
jgi:hypothetical protein